MSRIHEALKKATQERAAMPAADGGLRCLRRWFPHNPIGAAAHPLALSDWTAVSAPWPLAVWSSSL